METPGINSGGYLGWSPLTHPNYEVYNLDTRGNLTTIKRYADAANLDEDEDKLVIETRHYDITGNVRKAETSCCMQTTIDYSLSTQYAWPELQISGSPSESDVNNRNTSSVTYDFNTGLVMTSTDANDRTTPETEYDSNTLRPVREYSSTHAYNYHIYDDVAMTVIDFAYEDGLEGANFASRSDKFLDGQGRVIKEIAYGKDNAQDIVDIKYDQLGRVSQQTRPYRAGATPLWNTVTYDLLDRPWQTIAPNDSGVVTRLYNQPDPTGSSGQPGETVKVTDPWGRERWARSDALGRLVEVAEPNPGGDGTLSSGALITTYTYDALDRLVQVNQGVQTRTFRYDSLGRLTHQKLAERDATLDDGGIWVGTGHWSDVFTYDPRNLTESVDARGVKTKFIYNNDPLNRLREVQYDKSGSPPHLIGNIPVAPNVSYAYMTTGDKKRVQNINVIQGMGNETMSYDSEGRLSQVVQTFTGRESYPLVTNYIWDTLDRLKENAYPMQYGAGAAEIRKKVEPAYDVASRLDSLKFGGETYASEPIYNAASQITRLKIWSQTFENYEYDPNTGLLTGQNVMHGTTSLLDLKYNYTLNNDANNNGSKTGQLTGITDLKNTARNRAYEYDKLGRLAKVRGGVNAFTTNPNWSQTYSYNRYGNRSTVQHTELAMAPVNPGSQSRSDLIGQVGPGTGGAANRIFSVNDPFAALGINNGYGSIAAGFSDGDNNGTPVRGGPRVSAEEYSNAPSANVVGRESRAEHPAGAQPATPRKKYGYRGGLSPTAAQSNVAIVYPSSYQTPLDLGDYAVSNPSNTGHGVTNFSSNGDTWFGGSCMWQGFQFGGQASSIMLKVDWTENGYTNGLAANVFELAYSLDGGANWNFAFGHAQVRSSNSGTFQISLPPSQNISQIRVRDYLDASGSDSNGAWITTSISNIRLEITDTIPPVISNVAAGGIDLYSATINWDTNENFGSSGMAVKAPNILCHQCANAS